MSLCRHDSSVRLLVAVGIIVTIIHGINADSMQSVFSSFCTYRGAGEAAKMDADQFAKLARDLRLLDKKLTATDIDIIFERVKSKYERKIDYSQFEDAVALMAEIKYPGVSDGYERLSAEITAGKGSQQSRTASRTADTSKYSNGGSRSDESGPGSRNQAGRDRYQNREGYVGAH